MTDSIMRDSSGGAVEIRGWAQYGGADESLESIELTFLEIRAGASQSKISLDMSCDDLIAWCREHGFGFTDMREIQKSCVSGGDSW